MHEIARSGAMFEAPALVAGFDDFAVMREAVEQRRGHLGVAERVRAHVFLCMLAYYLEWHLRQRLAPMLYDDTDKQAAAALRASLVAKAERSPAAVTKQTTGQTEDGLPVHSFHTLMADLATLTRNTLVTDIDPERTFTLTARPTALQQKAFDLLDLARTQ